VDHIEHVASVAGIAHVGFGSDFLKEFQDAKYPPGRFIAVDDMDGRAAIAGLTGPSELPRLTEALIRRGFSDDEVNNIAGGNFLRVFRGVLDVRTGGSAGGNRVPTCGVR
jgi:membrane dipeptidase